MFPDAAQFARDVAALGISSGDTVVAYDSGGWVAAPRAWWMFLSFGHPDVKVLDGGLKKWLREGRPTHSGKVTPKPGKFQAKLDPELCPQPAAIARQSRNACRAIGRCAAACAFRRHALPSRGRACRSGHIPGSRNVPYAELFDAETGAMKPLDDLRQAFKGAGVDMTKPIVTTCGSGVSALVLTLALYRLGVRGTALYDGSWAEWGLPDGPPVATGPARPDRSVDQELQRLWTIVGAGWPNGLTGCCGICAVRVRVPQACGAGPPVAPADAS